MNVSPDIDTFAVQVFNFHPVVYYYICQRSSLDGFSIYLDQTCPFLMQISTCDITLPRGHEKYVLTIQYSQLASLLCIYYAVYIFI